MSGRWRVALTCGGCASAQRAPPAAPRPPPTVLVAANLSGANLKDANLVLNSDTCDANALDDPSSVVSARTAIARLIA